MATSKSASVFYICSQHVRHMPKPAAPTAALTVYELKEVHGVSSFATGGGTRHKGMPVRRLWPEKSLARAGVHVRRRGRARRDPTARRQLQGSSAALHPGAEGLRRVRMEADARVAKLGQKLDTPH